MKAQKSRGKFWSIFQIELHEIVVTAEKIVLKELLFA